MHWVYNLGGNKTPFIRKYGVDGGVTLDAGEPVVTGESVADNGGVTVATTIAAVGFMGVAVDTASSTDAQNAAGTNNQGEVTVTINPDAVYRAKFSGGATEDTSLTALTAASAVTAGTTVTGATDEFTIWAITGANVGAGWRRATAASTVVVAFPRDIAAGDTFAEVPIWIGSRTQFPQLTTNLTQIDASAAVDADNDNFVAVFLELKDGSDNGLTNSYAHIIGADHAFGPNWIDQS